MAVRTVQLGSSRDCFPPSKGPCLGCTTRVSHKCSTDSAIVGRKWTKASELYGLEKGRAASAHPHSEKSSSQWDPQGRTEAPTWPMGAPMSCPGKLQGKTEAGGQNHKAKLPEDEGLQTKERNLCMVGPEMGQREQSPECSTAISGGQVLAAGAVDWNQVIGPGHVDPMRGGGHLEILHSFKKTDLWAFSRVNLVFLHSCAIWTTS